LYASVEHFEAAVLVDQALEDLELDAEEDLVDLDVDLPASKQSSDGVEGLVLDYEEPLVYLVQHSA
jgi:hypothetical protein